MMRPSSELPLLTQTRNLLDNPIIAELEFFEPFLDDAAPDKVYALEIVERRLLPSLKRHRLVLLEDHRKNECLLFAKQLAWLLREGHEGNDPLPVKQWLPRSSLVDLGSVLDRAKEPSVFLFPSLEPHHLGGYDVRRFLDDLARHGHYGIITTRSQLAQWSTDPQNVEQAFWFDWKVLVLTPRILGELLLRRVEEAIEDLPEPLAGRVASLQLDSSLAGELTVEEVAARLKSSARIRSFVTALAQYDELDKETVLAIIEDLSDERRAIHQQFRGLSRRNQALALGLALFDSLFDDQAFSSVEFLMGEAWRDWDPQLFHFDHHELDHVKAFFQGFEQPSKVARIQCVSEASRRYLFEIGWALHRRRMLAALPVLARLARMSPGRPRKSRSLENATRAKPSTRDNGQPQQTGNSETERPDDESEESDDKRSESFEELEAGASRWVRSGRWRELFGSNLRNGLVRNRLSGSLSELGRLAPDAVEPILVELAGDSRISVQVIAADAMARWREFDFEGEGNRRLSRMLSDWHREAWFKEYSYSARNRQKAKEFVRLRATVALTLAHACVYDRPNHLDEKLVEVFKNLVVDRRPFVRKRFVEDTVPEIVQNHLKQLVAVLWHQVVPEADLIFATALGMAGAHRLRPAEARAVFQDWLRWAKSAPEQTETERTFRRHALAIGALAYGLVESRAGASDGSLSRQEVFEVLRSLLTTEEDRLVRVAVLQALLYQATTFPDVIGPFLQQTIEHLAMNERDEVVQQMTRIYLSQRSVLDRGDHAEQMPPDLYEAVDGSTVFPLWVDSRRPKTRIEDVLQEWLHDSENPVALQIAMECLAAFAQTDLEQRETQLRRLPTDGAEPSVDALPASGRADSLLPREKLRRLSFTGGVAAFLAAPMNRDLRVLLRTAMPEVLRRKKASLSDAVNIDDRQLIERVGLSDAQLANHLQRAVHYYRGRWLVLVLVVLLFIFALQTDVLAWQ